MIHEIAEYGTCEDCMNYYALTDSAGLCEKTYRAALSDYYQQHALKLESINFNGFYDDRAKFERLGWSLIQEYDRSIIEPAYNAPCSDFEE